MASVHARWMGAVWQLAGCGWGNIDFCTELFILTVHNGSNGGDSYFSPTNPVLPEKRELIARVLRKTRDGRGWQTRSCVDTSNSEKGHFFPSEAK